MLGIDSLRLEELRRFGGTAGNTRHLDRFLRTRTLSEDASTPMPRTFGSWVSILTGRSPVSTGARNNLTPRDVLAANPTIADVLRTAGYRTVYSTDEVRFANIDESFGFDEVITPPIGAADFILGTYNELPLPSVVINTRVGQAFFLSPMEIAARRRFSSRTPTLASESRTSVRPAHLSGRASDSGALAVLHR